MPDRHRLAQQLAQPAGLLGRQVSRQMEVANRAMVAAGVDALDVGAGHRVLEIGFGRGRTLGELVVRSQPGGRVTGVDHSPLMVRTARRRHRRQLAKGHLEILEGDASRLPLPDQSFDRVLAVNTVTYWPEPAAGLAEVARVLVPDGIAIIAVRSPAVLAALGIAGQGVHHLDGANVAALVHGAGLHAERITDGADRTGGYLVARVRQASPTIPE